jgi:hypothetical protein
MDLICILVGGRSQSEKVTNYMIAPMQHSGKGKIIEILKR